MDFVAFLIVNIVLFLRPAELAPELDQVPFYYFAMLACFACSIVPLLNLAFSSPLKWHPTVVLSLLMVALAAISLLLNRDLAGALDEEIEYLKVIAYFILFIAIVRTPARLQGVIACVALCMMVTAALGLLHYFEVIAIPNLKQMEENVRVDSIAGTVRRLRFTGLLDGPNEVAVFLSVLTFLCAYQLNSKKHGLAQYFWLLPIGLFFACILLTQSRGGLLSLLCGFAAFAVYGARRGNGQALSANAPGNKAPLGLIILAACLIPVLLLAVGSRQVELSTNAHSAQTRFGTWSDWLLEFRYNPVVGVGPRVTSWSGGGVRTIEADRKLLAHNSYLQPFADLGFLGGLSFLGAVGFCFITLHRYSFNKTTILDPDLARLQPYLMAAMASCAAGFVTLSINYLVPFIFVLAIPVAYYGMTPCIPPIKRPVLSMAAFGWLVVASIGFLALTYALVLIMPRQ